MYREVGFCGNKYKRIILELGQDSDFSSYTNSGVMLFGTNKSEVY